MVLRMPRPTTRENSSVFQFRCRVPSDLVDRVRGQLVLVELPGTDAAPAVTVSATAGVFIKFSLRTRDPAVAQYRSAVANTQVARYFGAWRGGATTLSQRLLVGLSGEVYRLYVEKFQDNPGDPADWAAFKAFNRAAAEGRLLNAPILRLGEAASAAEALAAFGQSLTEGVNALPPSGNEVLSLERRFGVLTDWVLQKHGLAIDTETRARLLKFVETAATDAAWALKRNAAGDYTPDPKAARFPAVELPASAVSLANLFERWQAEAKPSASTVSTWGGTVRSLKEHVGVLASDIRRITQDDIVAWKDASVARGLAAKTINDSYLGSVKALFNFAVANRLLPTNPAEGIRVAARARAGTRKLPYSDDEVARLLALAGQERDSARRWLPLLAASSGARIGELAQLWGSRVCEVEGITVLKLAPAEDGGSLKNEGSERIVPVHPAAIEAGFIDFVRSKGDGPLFYRKSSGEAAKRHASKGVTNRLATWIRSQGFTDARKSPNHALRHYFKSAAARAGVSDSMADALQGHAVSTVATRYRHFDVQSMAEAVASISIPPK